MKQICHGYTLDSFSLSRSVKKSTAVKRTKNGVQIQLQKLMLSAMLRRRVQIKLPYFDKFQPATTRSPRNKQIKTLKSILLT